MQYAIAVVIGGGPAGSAAAIAVAQSGLAVILVTRTTTANFKPGEMLPPNARPLLGRLGIPELCSLGHANASGVRSIWDHPEIGETDFLFNPYGTGWFLDRARFDQQLLSRASEVGVRVLSTNRPAVVDVRRTGAAWELKLGPSLESETLKCDFLIDATGRSSWLARCLGIQRVSMDRLIGVSALLPGQLLEDDRMYLQASEDGWWYVANLPGNKTVATWMTDSDLAASFPEGAKGMWQARFAELGMTRQAAPIAWKIVACSSSRLQFFAGDGWAAAGDAAAAFDPLSSQGICMALESGCRVVEQVHQQRQEGLVKQVESSGYADWLEKVWQDYLTSHQHYYGLIQRWPNSPFWQRRCTGIPLGC